MRRPVPIPTSLSQIKPIPACEQTRHTAKLIPDGKAAKWDSVQRLTGGS